ncbi:bifunctional diaminohydroxyphosphoribosylaminopyrimidine deaminase/5-amino-6-(5-phosphoribosylamino)uracil reductase RibD [Sphingomonas aerophila]
MNAAVALAARGRGRTAPNPNVGCVLVRDGQVVGRGWTQPGGRPHAEAVALAQAGEKSRDATCYVTLEPCAHPSTRGPACADLLVSAGVARVVAAVRDPDPRTDGAGFSRLADAGIEVVSDVGGETARRAMAGWLTRRKRGRPFVTLKLAMSLDGAVAMADGSSQWITGPVARAHAHGERSRHEAILVGRDTWDADHPQLDVRLPGLEARSPARVVLTSRPVEGSVVTIGAPEEIAALPGDYLLVEGGAVTAAAFLRADLVDRLLLYRAPVLVGAGRSLPGFGLTDLAAAHGRWRLDDARQLGVDRMEVYERTRCLPA